MAKTIVVDHVFKIFGDKPQEALELILQGADKQEIFRKTGQSIGVFDACFDIKAGEIFVIMGLSGSGKSTLVRMLNRLIEPSFGKILVDGVDIKQLSERKLRALRRKDISMVFQSFALMPHMTVLDNTAFGLELAGVPREKRRQQAELALEQVGLAGMGASYPDELSGGMQQRVGLARALASDPSILLMDEAFSALDPIIRAEMQTELLRLQEIRQRTLVFISHDLDEAMRIGDRIAIMRDGVVVQVGTPDEILRSPADDYVKSFIRGVNASTVFTAADIARKTVTFIAGRAECGSRAVLNLLEEMNEVHAQIVDAEQLYLGTVSVDSLQAALAGQNGPQGLAAAYLPDIEVIPADSLVSGLVGCVADAPYPVPVVDAEGRYFGTITQTTLLNFLDPQTPHLPTELSEKRSQA